MNYISPQVEQASRSVRTPADVLRARLPQTDALGDQTYYTIFERWPGKVRLETVEGPMIETISEALAALKQHEHAVYIFRNDSDVPRRDVSEDIALVWLADWIADGGNPEEDELPGFISAHITREEVVRIFSEDYPVMRSAI